MESIDFSVTHAGLIPEFWSTVAPGVAVRPLVRHRLFSVDLLSLKSGAIRGLGRGNGPCVLGGVSGTTQVRVGEFRRALRPGEFLLIPAIVVPQTTIEAISASKILTVADSQ